MYKTPRIFSLLLLSVAFLAGCRQPERVGEVVLDDEGPLPVPFEIVADGASARLTPPLEQAVVDAQGWDSLQAALTFRRAPAPVDFSGAMLLVAVAQAPSSGHALRFESIEQDSAGLVAYYTLLAPDADCITDRRPQQPFQVVRLRAVEGDVRFEKRKEALRCTFQW